MKMLFLCSTEFQLLTALHIKYHMHPTDEADIIVNNYHGEERELAERIRVTGMFQNVFYVRSYIENETLHKYCRAIIDGEHHISLWFAFKNSLGFIKIKLLSNLFGEKIYIKNMVADSEQLKLDDYEAFFGYIYGKRPILNNILGYILNHNTGCRINLLDEGVGSYIYSEGEPYLGIIDTYYVYEPDMLPFDKVKYRKIPSICRDDTNFIALLNDVFQFHSSDVEDYRNSVIIFDQGVWNKMPKYLQGSAWRSRLLFHNSYKRHLKEDKDFQEHIDIANFMIDNTAPRKIWIKLHPRHSSEVFAEYKKKEVKLVKRYDLPWELLALNCNTENCVFVTTYSSSVCLYNAVVDSNLDDYSCVSIYKLADMKFAPEMEQYFEELKRRYKNFYIPETLDEFVQIQQRVT